MSAPNRPRLGALLAAAMGCVLVIGCRTAEAQPAVRYMQGSQGLVAMRADAGASAPAPAHRAVDSAMVQGSMTQVLREPRTAGLSTLAAPAPGGAMSESVLPNGTRVRTMPPGTATAATAPAPRLTIAEPAGEVMPRPLVLYRKPASAAATR